MPDPAAVLDLRLREAMEAAYGKDAAGADPVVRRSAQERFGDYQANGAMGLAKRLGRPPREVAEAIVAAADLGSVCAKVEVAGPGFVNMRLEDAFLAEQAEGALPGDRLGVDRVAHPRTVVVDYAAPTVSKEMQAHHLRSSVIGDALARILEWQGHRVIRQDHIGDWGRPFGMLIEQLIDAGWAASGDRSIPDLDQLYAGAQTRFDSDDGFAERSRRRVVLLQSGDPATLEFWRALVGESERHFRAVYKRLGLSIGPEHARPESFYNDMLEPLADELQAAGIARIDDGALCAFPPGFKGKDGRPLPLIVRTSAGGYPYAATDLAGVRYSVAELGADHLVYVTDARQAQHFAMVFAVAREAGWLREGVTAEHVPFGSVLGRDGRPLKSREGTPVKLAGLLAEAVSRALAVVREKNPELHGDEAWAVAEAVGIGAVKYGDLSSDRARDYVFDLDRMLALEGNTAPYLQYAHARISSIFRRAGRDLAEEPSGRAAITLREPSERHLAVEVLGLGGALGAAAEQLQPHRLCTYLFDLASTFTAFYETCPVLRAEDDVRESRLMLCALSARALELGLGLLGIEAPSRM